MTDDRLDALMASMAPISEARVAELPLSEPEADLMEAIMSTSHQKPAEPGPPLAKSLPGGPDRPDDGVAVSYLAPGAGEERRGAGRRSRLALAILAAAAILVVALIWSRAGSKEDVDVASKPQKQVEQAEPTRDRPWILLDAEGWAMTESGTFTTDFRDDAHHLQVLFPTLPPGAGQLGNIDGFPPSWDELPSRSVLGQEAQILQSREEREAAEMGLADPAGTDEFIAQWEVDGLSYRVVAAVPTADDFYRLVDGLHYVDFDAFAAAASSASYVAPADQPAVFEELLTDVPRPAGFDAAPLVVDNDGIGEKRRELVNIVGKSVICGWVETWIAATDAGDDTGADEAVAAMRAFLDAPIVGEMKASPSYQMIDDHFPVMVEEFADAMQEGRPVTLTGRGPGLEPVPGEPMAVRDYRDSGLGCITVNPRLEEIPPGEGSPEEEAARRDLEREAERLSQPPG
jgi:hypothetical protein